MGVKMVSRDDYDWRCSVCGRAAFVDLGEKGLRCFECYGKMKLKRKGERK